MTQSTNALLSLDGRRGALLLASVLALLCLGGCSKPPTTTEIPRPVRVTQLADQAETQAVFAGEVRARYELKVGFRVGGKITHRYVNVGDRVKAGQVIAELDPADYRLGADALGAQFRAARADYELAASDLRRYHDLRQQNFISAAEYERRETSAATLEHRVAALKAQYEQAELQRQYTRLLAEHDSLVTALPAEVEQVVAAAQPVAVLARLSELEVAVDIPETARVARDAPVTVRFWAAPNTVFEGRVREVAASADSSSRTFAVRISLPHQPAWVQIGMSATVAFSPQRVAQHHVIPLSALFVPQGDPARAPRVWVLEGDNTVRSVPVTVGIPVGGDQIEVDGLRSGQKIVTAGASRLREGQMAIAFAPSVVGRTLVSDASRLPARKDAIVPIAARHTPGQGQ